MIKTKRHYVAMLVSMCFRNSPEQQDRWVQDCDFVISSIPSSYFFFFDRCLFVLACLVIHFKISLSDPLSLFAWHLIGSYLRSIDYIISKRRLLNSNIKQSRQTIFRSFRALLYCCCTFSFFHHWAMLLLHHLVEKPIVSVTPDAIESLYEEKKKQDVDLRHPHGKTKRCCWNK